MTVYFISRHTGAQAWAQKHQIAPHAVMLEHLDLDQVQPGDQVVGQLPVHLAAEVCRRAGEYLHLSMEVPRKLRGRELTLEEMEACGARIERFVVTNRGG